MGIQTWLIVMGVACMTLIVWHGGRRKSLDSVLPEIVTTMTRASRLEAFPVAAQSMPIAFTAGGEIQPSGRLPRDVQGSRIGMATRVSGRLIANEPVVIKGRIEGVVIAQDHRVTVTMSGRVSAYLEGREVSVDGEVAGRLKAGEKITLLSRADVRGVLESTRLECMAGARFQGEVAGTPCG